MDNKITDFSNHTSTNYNQELEDIKNEVMQMAGFVEKQMQEAITSLLNADGNLADKVSESDDTINDFEKEIDKKCVQIIAKRQPAASDLRLLISIAKVITDLERIGDESARIGQYAVKLSYKKCISNFNKELDNLAGLVMKILTGSLEAFTRIDLDLASKLLGKQKKVNREIDKLLRLLITYMMEDPRTIKPVIKVAWCARSLERISSHSLNICEYVIYLVHGKDIRHLDDKDKK